MGSDAPPTYHHRSLIASLRTQLLRIPGLGSLLARRPVRACLLISFSLIVSLSALWRLDLFNITFKVWVPYFLRPLWDHDRRYPYSYVVPNYGWNGDAESTCKLYGMEPVAEQPKIFDIFLFSGEKDLLEIRLRTLSDVVDKFVILEGTESFQGQRKELVYPLIRDDPAFEPFRDRIQYRVVDANSGGGFKAEGMHRGMNMLRAAEEAGLKQGDIFVVSDLDEIPRPDVLRILSSCGPWPEGNKRVQLDLRNHLYAFSLTYRERTRAASVNRYDPAVPVDSTFTHGPAGSEVVMADAGWHCSWCLQSLSQFKAKALGYSHQDSALFLCTVWACIGFSLPFPEASFDDGMLAGGAKLRSIRFLHRKIATTSTELQRRICQRLPTVDGFIPEAYEYKEMAMLSLPLRFTASSSLDVPGPVRSDPKFNYLLMDCRRPEIDTPESISEMENAKPWGREWQFGEGTLPWLD